MKKISKEFNLGYFTDEVARELLCHRDSGSSQAIALHIECQSYSWGAEAFELMPGQKLKLSRHGEFCARLLAGQGQDCSWDTGFVDEPMMQGRAAFMAMAQNPNVRVISISSYHKFVPPYHYREYRDLHKPVVLIAAGNNGRDWIDFQNLTALTGEVYMPGYVRVGESFADGEIHSCSQASGPALVCDHPRDIRGVMVDMRYYPTSTDVQKFLSWPHHGLPEKCVAKILAYEPPEKDKQEFSGTSASAPHAGAMIMRHTANMKSITSFDILPALILAAQSNAAPPWVRRRVETQSGMIFDPFEYGHGVLVEECLSEALESVWDIRKKSGKATMRGEFSQPHTIEGKGLMTVRTEKAQGPVINTVLTILFANEHYDRTATESRIPEFIMLQSPQGTLIHLPLLYDRQDFYRAYVRAGYQTSAFFGEDISKGEWRVRYASTDENPLPIAMIKITAHTMHEKSPGHILLKGCQKAMQIERS